MDVVFSHLPVALTGASLSLVLMFDLALSLLSAGN